MPTTSVKSGRAIIIGGSIAGLACARVLSQHFEQVTVIEREPRPTGSTPRKCVPQGAHTHVLLEPGVHACRRWFPGLLDELTQGGGHLIDTAADSAIYHYGGWKPRPRSDMEMFLCTRPFLEWHVRQAVERLPNVEFLYQHTAETLLWDASRRRVRGVSVKGADDSRDIVVDLVVDTAGRGSRAPRWLAENGFDKPQEQTIEIDLAYTSRIIELPADFDVGAKVIAVYSRVPGRRGGFVCAIEGNRWIVSLTGYLGDHAPTNDEGFQEFARSLPVSEVRRVIEHGTPISPIAQHKIPSSRWHRYDKLRTFPEGLLVLGDSVVSLNPVYAQGMTISFQCARTLEEALSGASMNRRHAPEFYWQIQKKLPSVIGTSWMLSTMLDLRLPEVEGHRPPGIGALQWLVQNVCDVSSLDPAATRIFLETLHMRRGPEAFGHPALLRPLLKYTVKQRFGSLEPLLDNGPMPRSP